MKKYLGLILCGAVLLTGCTKVPKLENGQELVAEIEGKQFTAEDLYEALRVDYGTNALINMIDNYITEQLLTDEMKENADAAAQSEFEQYKTYYSSVWDNLLTNNGYTDEKEFLEDIKKSYRSQEVLKDYVKSTITDKEIEEYYKSDIYGEQTVRHILVMPEKKENMTDEEKTKAKEEALAKAKLLINQLSSSTDLENDFSELAKKESGDEGSKANGGLISNFTNESGLVEEFFEASLKLEVGKMTAEPVESEFGYHIIYKVSQKEKPALEDVKDTVISKLVTKNLAKENATQVYWTALREKNGLNIYDDTIKSKYNATISQY